MQHSLLHLPSIHFHLFPHVPATHHRKPVPTPGRFLESPQRWKLSIRSFNLFLPFLIISPPFQSPHSPVWAFYEDVVSVCIRFLLHILPFWVSQPIYFFFDFLEVFDTFAPFMPFKPPFGPGSCCHVSCPLSCLNSDHYCFSYCRFWETIGRS